MALVNCYSAKLSATLTTAFGFVKLLAAAMIIAVGVLQFNKGIHNMLRTYTLSATCTHHLSTILLEEVCI